ncbi:uncharacterized protein LOC144743284 [Ciona intestinalis]
MKRKEILFLVQKKFTQYAWSIATLDRRLRFFDIKYIHYDTPLEDVCAAIDKELQDTGKHLGYRAMNQKLRCHHNILVPRHLVQHILIEKDSEGIALRNLKKKAKKPKQPFQCDGPLHLVSMDGHDKLCGYQNYTFPLGIYGAMDTFSRKILFLFVTYSNSNPLIIGKKYLEYICSSYVMPRFLRLDRGTETGKMATIHSFLRSKHGDLEDPTDSVIYGPSNTNKIERWWRELHERLEKFFKVQLKKLMLNGKYHPHCLMDRQLLFYVYEPIVSRECEIFVSNWNSHRIRHQKNIHLPTGIPDHLFQCPEFYGTTCKGLTIDHTDLKSIAEVSGVLCAPDEWLDEDFKKRCIELLPNPELIASKDAAEKYCYLRHNFLSNC